MKNLNILLVEDNAQLRECLVHLLDRENVRVTISSDGQEAVECICHQTVPFDLVLSDVEMPRMDGWHLVAWMHEHDAKLPIVLMSASEPEEFIRMAKKVGACGALTKPFGVGWLRQLLGKVSGFTETPRPADFYCPLTA